MSFAYQCDNCRELYEGFGAPNRQTKTFITYGRGLRDYIVRIYIDPVDPQDAPKRKSFDLCPRCLHLIVMESFK